MELLFWVVFGLFGLCLLISGIVEYYMLKVNRKLDNMKARESILAGRISWLEEKYINALDEEMAEEERFEWEFTEEEINKVLDDDEVEYDLYVTGEGEEVIDDEVPAFENEHVDIVDLMLGPEKEES